MPFLSIPPVCMRFPEYSAVLVAETRAYRTQRWNPISAPNPKRRFSIYVKSPSQAIALAGPFTLSKDHDNQIRIDER